MRYRFDQIAINSKAKKKPVEEDRHHYIGLEHLDSGSLVVSRWGADVAPKGEKLLMKKGDVLFGKRRAYQKKVAIAPFDGIFSAHGMVLRPNEDVIDKDFFPMFISSDYFLDTAIGLSVGSLSPTINWKDLARQEFELPSMDKQRELAQVLWAMEETKVGYQHLLADTEELVKSRFVEMFGDPIVNSKGLPTEAIGDVCLLKAGVTTSAQDIHEQSDDEHNIPCYGGNGVRGYVRTATYQGDYAIIGRQGALCGNVQFAHGNFHATEHAVLVTPKIPFNLTWLYITLREMNLNRFHTGAAQPGLAVKTLNKVRIMMPDIELQNRFAELVVQADKSKFVNLNRILRKERGIIYDNYDKKD